MLALSLHPCFSRPKKMEKKKMKMAQSRERRKSNFWLQNDQKSWTTMPWRERRKSFLYMIYYYLYFANKIIHIPLFIYFQKVKSKSKSKKQKAKDAFQLTSLFTSSHFNKVTTCHVTSLKVTSDLTHDATSDLTLDVTCVPRSNSKCECARNHSRARVR